MNGGIYNVFFYIIFQLKYCHNKNDLNHKKYVKANSLIEHLSTFNSKVK